MNLLLLPGMDGTGLLFEPLREALPGWLKPRTVAYPAREALGYADLLPLVRDACPTMHDFVIVAESFSGPLALMLAATAPPGLRGVVLSASFVRCPLRAPLRWLAASARPVCFRLPPPFWLARRFLLGRHGTDRVRYLLAQAIALPSAAAMAARARAIASVDATEPLKRCRVPLLYLAGSEDRVVRPRSLAAIRHIRPDIEMAELPGPHLLLQACPEEAAKMIGAWVKRISARPDPLT